MLYQHGSDTEPIRTGKCIIDDRLIGLIVLEGRLTADYHPHFLQEEFPRILEKRSTPGEFQPWLQHEGTAPHSVLRVTQYLKRHTWNIWIGRGGVHA
jgi:hypothetical protein